ncbi:MAG: glycosyltransferase family 39 protein [bacterium]|nr:glycosyltransferase family 39 protein [bacterium]
MNRRTLLPLITILVLAVALRLIQLGERAFWYDEAFTALFTGRGIEPLLQGTITPVNGTAADIHPLLYYASVEGWRVLFGSSVFALRLWSVLLGIATIGVMFLIGRDLFDTRTGLLTALITAIAPFHVQYSQEARMYALMGLCLAFTTWAFIRAFRSDNIAWGWWAALGIGAALAMYTQQLSAFYLAALGLIPLIARRRSAMIGMGFGAFVALTVYAPWLLILPGQLSRVAVGYWIDVPPAARVLLTLRSFVVVNLDVPPPAALIGLGIALVLVIFLFVHIVMRRRRQSVHERGAILWVVWLFAAPIAGMWLVSQVRPVYLDRGLIGSALMLYLAFGWLFARGGLPAPLRIGLAGLGLIAAGIGLNAHYGWNTFPNAPYPQLVGYVQSQVQPGDVVIHQDKTSALPSIYYAGQTGQPLEQRYLRDEPNAPDDTLLLPTQQALGLLADACIQAAGRGAARVWWVMFTFAPGQFAAAGIDTLENDLVWLNNAFAESETVTLNDLSLTLYANRTIPADQGDCAP